MRQNKIQSANRERPMKTAHWLALFLCLAFGWIVWHHTRLVPFTNIMQVGATDFDVRLLAEKQPIAIEGLWSDVRVVRDAWFARGFWTRERARLTGGSGWQRGRGYCTVAWAAQNGPDVLLAPSTSTMVVDTATGEIVPHPESSTVVAMQLAEGQAMLVPRGWWWRADEGTDVRLWEVDTWATALCRWVGR